MRLNAFFMLIQLFDHFVVQGRCLNMATKLNKFALIFFLFCYARYYENTTQATWCQGN